MGLLQSASAFIIGTVLMTTAAQAAQVLVLNYNDREFRGNGAIQLKQDLQRAYPRLRLDAMELQGVRLIAKSRAGQGEAVLYVGRDSSYSSNIGGDLRGWDSRDARSYSVVDMNSPGRRSEGPWQIGLRGNIRVKQVQVKVEEDRRGPGGPGGPGRPGDGNGPGRPGNGHGPDRPGDGRPGPRNHAEEIIGAIGKVIIDEIGKR